MSGTATERLPLFDGLVNASVLPEDELRLSKQCRKMYHRLLKGPATIKPVSPWIEITPETMPKNYTDSVLATDGKIIVETKYLKDNGTFTHYMPIPSLPTEQTGGVE